MTVISAINNKEYDSLNDAYHLIWHILFAPWDNQLSLLNDLTTENFGKNLTQIIFDFINIKRCTNVL